MTPPQFKSLDATTFAYLQPTVEQQQTMDRLRQAAAEYALVVDNLVPPGPDKTYILRRVRETAMWVNVAVTREANGAPR